MAERIYTAVTSIVHGGHGYPAGRTLKGDDTDKAIVQALAFGLIKPITETAKQRESTNVDSAPSERPKQRRRRET